MMRRGYIVMAAMVSLVLLLCAGILQLRAYRHRYQLSVDDMAKWKSYGGVWSLDHGVFRNNSEERGAKLVSGSSAWTNMSLSADVRIDQANGDIGLLIRSKDEDIGVDAYNGYYAALRAQEGTLIAGRSNYSWSEVQPVRLPGGVHPGIWYHLHLVMYGCRLAISARNLSTQQSAALVLYEKQCVTSGRIGLRSLSSGGSWRNVKLKRATVGQYNTVAAQAHGEEQPQPLTTEAAYARHLANYLPFDPVARGFSQPEQLRPALHLGDLIALRGNASKRVVVRGTVMLTEPDIYIEDATGGALIKNPKGRSVNVGEGIEVTGDAHALIYSAEIDNASLRIISTGTPAPPLAVTPWQAASGAYDARFIELEGHLLSKPYAKNGNDVLDLADGGETFRALYSDPSGQALRGLRVNSHLRVQGVCVLGRTYTHDLIPFIIFLRSPDDVQVLQGPPWWTPPHVALVVCLIIVLAWSVQFVYFRFRQWQQEAILRERERIAHDIHDTMAQSFAGIGYQIQGLRTSILHNAHISHEQIAEQLASTSELVSHCHTDASHTIEMLGAVSREEQGDLLSMLAHRTFKISGGRIRVYQEEQGIIHPLSIRVRAVLFSIGQEAISNAITHGQSPSITFIVRYDKRSATMIIEDDGCGFDATPEGEGFGILGIRHRAAEIGGTVEILSAPGVGTRVGVTFPLSRLNVLQRFRFRALLRRRLQTHTTPADE